MMKKYISVVLFAGLASSIFAQVEVKKTTLDIYGHAMLDMGYQVKQNNPDWYDVVRPSQLPTYDNEYGENGNFFMSVRQTRLGFKTSTPTSGGDSINTIFEFELFGTGGDAGQTTFRLRHAYGEYKQFGAGQTWSVFMDPDVFPNSIEYWGPSGMIFYRNIQARYTPVKSEHNSLAFSLENPGAGFDSGSGGINIDGHFPVPDFAAQYRRNEDWGHVQAAGILRYIDTDKEFGADWGDFVGWGINLSGNYKINEDTVRLQVVYGEGIGWYLNDGPVDVAPKHASASEGEVVPLLGVVAFYDHTWSEKYTSSIGYSMYQMDNTAGQAIDAIHRGDYALVNLLYHPTPAIMYGIELQYGARQNKDEGMLNGHKIEDTNDIRCQFSFKYTFGMTFNKNKSL